jgi:hypothetical protein
MAGAQQRSGANDSFIIGGQYLRQQQNRAFNGSAPARRQTLPNASINISAD